MILEKIYVKEALSSVARLYPSVGTWAFAVGIGQEKNVARLPKIGSLVPSGGGGCRCGIVEALAIGDVVCYER